MKTIAFIHQKGGTGKTSLAIASALAMALERKRVLLLDLDPQGTAATWGERFGDQYGIAVRAHGPSDLSHSLRTLEHSFDVCILDCPPNLTEQTLQTLNAADHLLIPIRPSLPDIWALDRLAALMESFNSQDQATTHRVVFNQYRGEPLEDLRKTIETFGLQIADNPIDADTAFSQLFSGKTPTRSLLRQLSDLLPALP